MKPVIHSASINGQINLKAWVAEDDRDVLETVVLSIGVAGGSKDKTSEFTLRIATPAGLARARAYEGVIASRALLVLDRYDPDRLWHWLEVTVAAAQADTWLQCVERLGRHFNWEYDGLESR